MRKQRYIPTTILILTAMLAGTSCEQKPQTDDGFSLISANEKMETAWASVEERITRIKPPVFPDRTVSVVDHGAKNDTLHDSRAAIMAAIQSCSDQGGGRVIFPPGMYLCKGPIHLESNIDLHLSEGAELRFSDDADDYLPLVKVRWEGTVVWNYSPLIYAFEKENIAITGKGIVNGNGREWSIEWRKKQKPDKARLRQMGNDQIPDEQRVFGKGFLDLDGDGKDDGYGDGQQRWLRPTLVEAYNCRNVLLDGPTFKNSPFWTLHFPFTKNITCRNLFIRGGYLNDDGIDPDSSEDVLIENCDISTHDDAISIKAGRDQDAWERGGSSNIIIRNCRLESQTNAFCIGSEMSGGVSDVFIEDCQLYPRQHAINFKCNLDRGGQVSDVFIRNMEIDSLKEAMFIFRMDYHGYRGNHFPTKFNDFYVTGLKCRHIDEYGFKIVGVPDQLINRIFLKDIDIDYAGQPHLIQHTENIRMHNVTVNDEKFEGIIANSENEAEGKGDQ